MSDFVQKSFPGRPQSDEERIALLEQRIRELEADAGERKLLREIFGEQGEPNYQELASVCIKQEQRIAQLELLEPIARACKCAEKDHRIDQLESFLARVALSPYWTLSVHELLTHKK
jgi:hypothetical protein